MLETYGTDIVFNEPLDSIKTKYNDTINGAKWTREVYQGISIDIFEKDTKNVSFEIDTTTLENNAIIAFQTKPFVKNQKIYTTPNDSKIEISIDGVKNVNDYATITPGKHTIS